MLVLFEQIVGTVQTGLSAELVFICSPAADTDAANLHSANHLASAHEDCLIDTEICIIIE